MRGPTERFDLPQKPEHLQLLIVLGSHAPETMPGWVVSTRVKMLSGTERSSGNVFLSGLSRTGNLSDHACVGGRWFREERRLLKNPY